MEQKKLLSVILPCYNEEKVITKTGHTLFNVLLEIPYDFEIIFVNDGSRDNTEKLLMELASEDSRYKYISFSRNFGKESAMLAGLRYSKGDCVIIMDSDLQHPPELIPEMIKKYEEGYDQVIAQRNRKGDAVSSKLFAKLYYKIANKLVDVKMVDGAGDFRLLSRKAVDALISLKENNRFSKGLFSWIGFNQIYLPYDNALRADGESKWSFRRLISYGIDGVLSFNNKPLRVCIYLGSALIILSLIYLIYLFVQILVSGISTPGYFTTILLITCLGGTQLISIGIIGEYIGRIYYEVKGRPNYFVDKTNIEKEEKESENANNKGE